MSNPSRDDPARREAEHIALFDNLRLAVVFQDASGAIIRANRAAERILGLTLDQMQGLTSMDPRWRSIHLDGSHFPGDQHPAMVALATGKPVEGVLMGVHRPDREQTTWIRIDAYPLFHPGEDKAYEAFATFEDITERKLAQDALAESEERYRQLFEELPAGLSLHEMIRDESGKALDYRFIEVNPAFERQTGLRAPDIVGKTVREAIPSIEDYWIERYGRVEESGNPEEFENYVAALDRYYEVRAYRPHPGRFAVISSDVTDRRRAAREIEQLLDEKELLLKEVHHRIKNNMSMVAGLLSLQASALTDQAAIEALDDMRNRVVSFMLIYDRLYRSADYRTVELESYMEELIADIAEPFKTEGRIEVATRVESLVLDAKHLSQLAIVANELITNAFKYAFPDGRRGRLEISIARIPAPKGAAPDSPERLELVVADDGVGLPKESGPGKRSGFGLMLVETLVGQLGGELRVSREGGARFVVVVPLPRAEPGKAAGGD